MFKSQEDQHSFINYSGKLLKINLITFIHLNHGILIIKYKLENCKDKRQTLKVMVL